ncbi:phenylacetate--CoA ligase family protein [Dyella nitratireducens]|uniref:Capsular polysaccharide biosynthesis protein n=1 Tax=Dyella nitratireducens TaxID=1849580 RepID=A0ABQ1GBE2_9GAMM|nr:phenylacetate--CoA ligase family protein [Dyella nitratireducens]GGA40490.1 capsular polysaccharide biosynthesis protein [Dyella nitratireducens]GLQ40570.1 capsular polysaccharide biosynthesis protein [Dyella nitratireducens]
MNSLYEAAFRRVLFPAYETGLRRRRTLAYLDGYRRDQWLAPEQIAALQWERLQQLLEHCYREVPYYRRRWRELGIAPRDIRNLDDYANLPTLSKADIREHFDELKADSWRDRLLYKATGGSTGEPMRFGFTRESNDRRTAVMWRGYEWAGSRMGRRTLFLWGGPVGDPTRAHQLKDRFYNAVFARRILNSFKMTEANMAEYADAIDRYRPDIIVAYVGPLVQLAQWLIASGRKIWQPHAIIGGAEAMHVFQRDAIQQAFMAPAFNTYGCREFMLIAAECEQRHGLHVNSDHLVVELQTPQGAAKDGQTGDVVITDLFNYGMPFVRYANGDMATASTARCACGRGLPLLTRVDGRVLDAIRTPSGHVLPGEFFPHMLKDVPGLQRFQLVQRRLDRLDLSIVRGAGFDDASLAYIRREVDKVLGDSVQLHCHFVDDIPLTHSGKRRVTVSELTP